MKTLPKDISKKFHVPIYTEGITLLNTKNIVTRVKKNGLAYIIWYLDENEICQRTTLQKLVEENTSLCGLHILKFKDTVFCYSNSANLLFTPNGVLQRNGHLDKMILKELKVGEHASRLVEIAETIYIRDKQIADYTDFEKKFHRVEKPIYVGENKKAFDFIKVCITCASYVTKEDVIQYKKELDKWVLVSLECHKQFTCYGIPITALNVTNLVLTRDKRLEYTFEIKKELREIFETM